MATQLDRRGPSGLNDPHRNPLNKTLSTLVPPIPVEIAQEPSNLIEILEKAAKSSAVCTFYSQANGNSGQHAKTTTYAELYSLAKAKAPMVTALATMHERASGPPIVLLHFDSIEENIVWFWATVIAGLSPAISTPLPTNVDQRQKHLAHIASLLEQPIVLTANRQLSELQGTEGFHISAIEHLSEARTTTSPAPAKGPYRGSSPKVLMLTSGSSGNAKAVELQPWQIIAAAKGKSGRFDGTRNDVFLNWIGFDHVANVTECHIHAMYLCADQIHIPASEVITNPWLFLSLISHYRVSATFAPNFFLARLLQTVDESSARDDSLDLSCLKHINSGGEANVVETATRLTNALSRFGAKENIICPGFGMTETCAGSIYSRECPDYDVQRSHEFASLGKPVKGLQMRIMKDNGDLAGANEVGILQVTGTVVFKKYYNNPKATAESFTQDGWFVTGDKAFIDENKCLSLAGREKEVINLNGVKYSPHEIEAALEEAGKEDIGIMPSFTAVFSIRPPNSQQEEICVLYHPTFSFNDVDLRIKAADAIVRIVGERTSARPKHIVPLPKTLLPKSALGKLSRTKLRTAFENGEFREYEDRFNTELKSRRAAFCDKPTTGTETLILQELSKMLKSAFVDQPVGTNSSIFDLGVTSVDLFLLGQRIQEKAGLRESIPVGTLLTDPTIRGIAAAIDQMGQDDSEYIPIVPLQKQGSKTPLFLVHPGSGDVLIFVALSKYFPDRPVYGIRTKGLYSKDDYFKSLHEMADCYINAIKKIQPEGPYAIAGYSLGSSVAYEMAKLLESQGDKVPFLGILDSPPHIRHLIAEQDFIDVLLNVAYFLELITEDYALAGQVPLHEKSEDAALDVVMSCAPPDRLEILSIDKARLKKITEVTLSFGTAGRYYEPQGAVSAMDVFWVTPLLWVAKDRKEWMDTHLSKWVDFSNEAPKFHECAGVHSKMLNAEFVDGVARKMRSVIQARGV
ncbi:MAG: hypothetical protein Q9164_006823 [Protoblastenia rupestris]